ncbi:MAG: Lpg1974 family pore-forming outer membrane protein [Chlamydiota bacterium]
MKKIGFFFGIFCFASLLGQIEPSRATVGYDQGYSVENQLVAGYNAPGRIHVKGNFDVNLSGSFLYLIPREGGLEIASKYVSAIPFHPTCLDVDFDWKAGFKVGMGWSFGHDDWNLRADYFRYHGTHKNQTDADISSETLVPSWLNYANQQTSNTSIFSHATGIWQLKMDLLDLELSRPFYVGKSLIFSPFVGIEGGWISQFFEGKYLDPYGIPRSIHHQSSWLIGPSVGLNFQWIIIQGFSFFTNVLGSFFYQQFDNSMKEYLFTEPGNIYMSMHLPKKGYCTPQGDITIGFQYGSYFCEKKYHGDISIGYEFMIFGSQNHMRALQNNLTSTMALQGLSDGNFASLTLQGLILTAKFDF